MNFSAIIIITVVLVVFLCLYNIPASTSLSFRNKIIVSALVLTLLFLSVYAYMYIIALGGREPYIHLTQEEEEEIDDLSQRYGCKVTVQYNNAIRLGKKPPPISSSLSSNIGTEHTLTKQLPAPALSSDIDSICSVSFSWKEKQTYKSLCRQDTSYLRQFAYNLLPELFEKMKYIKDYPTIVFHFSTDDDTHPVNGWICNKTIIIKR